MDSELREDRCETCRFFHRFVVTASNSEGQCLRYPPAVAVYRDSFKFLQSEVETGDWCGEWQPKCKVTEYASPLPTVAEVMAVANSPPSA